MTDTAVAQQQPAYTRKEHGCAKCAKNSGHNIHYRQVVQGQWSWEAQKGDQGDGDFPDPF